jgi:cell division protein FtsQ
MARSQAPETTTLFGDLRWGRFAFWLGAGVFLMVGTLFAWHRTEEFLIKDDRFRIAEADDIAGPSSAGLSPDLLLEGIHYASASQIRHVFAEDFGRSLYLVPLQKRRQQLMEIDWVEDATVSKIWPDTLKITVHERVPVAFVRLPRLTREATSRLALIDRDGFILRPRVAAKFTLPVISGIKETEPIEDRKARVHRALGLLHDVGPYASQISEVQVADVNNIVVAEHVGNSVVNLMVGGENFQQRLSNFLANYNEIRRKRPDVTTLDLRVDGVITALGDKHFEQ